MSRARDEENIGYNQHYDKAVLHRGGINGSATCVPAPGSGRDIPGVKMAGQSKSSFRFNCCLL